MTPKRLLALCLAAAALGAAAAAALAADKTQRFTCPPAPRDYTYGEEVTQTAPDGSKTTWWIWI